MARRLPSVAKLVALANRGRLYKLYRDRPDHEKIAVVACMIGREGRPAQEALGLLGTLAALDLKGVRIVFTLLASSSWSLWHVDLTRLARLLERAPAGTFHDAELRRLFRKIKYRAWSYILLDGSDLARRIEAALGLPETDNAPTSWLPHKAEEKLLDVWMDTWEQLLDAVRAANGKISRSLRTGSRKARRFIAANRELGWRRDLMDLETRRDQKDFRERRVHLPDHTARLPPLDRDWLARAREQEAEFRKLGPINDWSTSAIPGIARLSKIRVGRGQNLVDFLRAFRGTVPTAAWSKAAVAVSAGPRGAAIRQALIGWLDALAVHGPFDARVRLWYDIASLRRFRHQVLEDIAALRHVRSALDAEAAASAAALIAFFDANRPVRIGEYVGGYLPLNCDPSTLSGVAASLVRSAVWLLACWHDGEVVAAVGKSAELTMARSATPWESDQKRSLLAANACILALGEIATAEAVQALGRIKLTVRDERLLKQIAKAMERAAKRAGVSTAELEEMAVPTFGLDAVGLKAVSIGAMTATLKVASSTAVPVELVDAEGRPVKSPPAAIKSDPDASAALKQIKATARSIAQALPVHRQRIESVYLTQRTWPFPLWRERYLDHPLVGTLARRLIWTVTNAEGQTRSLKWHDGALVDATDAPEESLDDRDVVTLWHPLDASDAEIAEWRTFLIRHKVSQPFKQAHRELYPLTDAERTTATYSNRFAGHILRQHQSVALARLRGWRATFRLSANLPNDEPTYIRIPDFGLAAEVWTEPAGGEDTEITGLTHPFIATDRVRFRAWLPRDGRDGALGDPVPLDTVPPRIFSEVMRDVDLFVGVASIGNDPAWIDGGADAAHPTRWHAYWTSHSVAELDVAGRGRRQFLTELLPSLAIADQCALEDRHLAVRGRLGTYRIHLGSGNILTEGDRYLCIVPQSRRDALDVFLPFEGDRMMSIILSKAVMLAADDRITDPAIVSQLRR